MMYPRLLLAKVLLASGGTIFKNSNCELAQLRQACYKDAQKEASRLFCLGSSCDYCRSYYCFDQVALEGSAAGTP